METCGSCVMWAAISRIDLARPWATLLGRVVVGVVVYSVMLLALDREARSDVLHVAAALRKKLAVAPQARLS